MVPTLAGRIQTRIFLLATVGVFVTAWLTPLLPLPGPISASYKTTYIILATVLVLGIAWELLYHLLMQWRWEKDWPSLFGLATGVPEGLLVWLLLAAHAVPGVSGMPGAAFVIDFIVVWVCVWLVAQGPMRVPFIRWRFRGGRLV
jgi:Kef-type K+ transport system membrane component KefB